MSILFKNAEILAMENGEFCVLSNGFLGVNGDRIDYIGETAPKHSYDEEKDSTGKLLTPGLINCHCHSPMTLLRGVGSDLPLQEWLFDKVFPIEDRLTAEDMSIGNKLGLLEMIACGTTSYSDMYFKTETAVANTVEAGLRANLCRPVQCFDPNEKYSDEPRVKESLALFASHNGDANGRIRIDFSIHAEYTCTEAIAAPYAADCKAVGGRMHIHLSETKKEHDECVAKYGCTPAEWFNKLGVFDSPTAAAHCVWLTESDRALLKQKGVSVIHCPTSNMKLGSGFAPVPEMLAQGINVTLGTDGAASNNNLNMMEEIHLAAVMHNGRTRDPLVMKPTEVLKMATVNGAKLQGRPDTGSLEVGKKADVVAFDLDRPHLYPNRDTLALLAYSAQGSDVCMTMVDGKVLYENGEFLTLDREKIMAEAKASVNRIYG